MQHLKATKPCATTKEFSLKVTGNIAVVISSYFLVILRIYCFELQSYEFFLIKCIRASYVFKHSFAKSICKDSANREQNSQACLSCFAEMQPILCKDNIDVEQKSSTSILFFLKYWWNVKFFHKTPEIFTLKASRYGNLLVL